MIRYKAVFVDDEYMILEGLKMIVDWNELGFEVVYTAKSATEALGYLNEHPVDLLITDINMPDMSGIELVRQAKREGQTFFSIILSGYQEFEYVKEGMQLGVKNYLLKPVNKEELKKSVSAIYQELKQRQELNEQKELYQETSLLLWLNDELNETEYFNLLKHISSKDRGPYTPLLATGNPKMLQELVCYFQEIQQNMLVKGRTGEDELIVIYNGSRAQLLMTIRALEQRFSIECWQLIVGETISEWESLYKSFEKVKQVQSLRAFYPDLLPREKILQVDIMNKEELPLLSFSKALTIGDVKTIQQELDKIFDQLLTAQTAPEHVRYFSFLLFNDIYRQSPTLTSENYEMIISEIRNSTTIVELRRLFEKVLAMVRTQNEKKRYTETIQQAVAIIDREYTQDLSLKSVAKSLHLSVVYLGQLFKKETDLSFNQYLNLIRIKKAQELLLQTQQTINEISDAIGYNNTNYFSKMFKKLNGITPKEFRDTYQKEYDSI